MLLIPVLFGASSLANKQSKGRYTILPQSTLQLHGKSNINNFNCDCTQKWGSYPVSYETNDENTCWYFDEVHLAIEVASLDCRHKAITRDLAKTLKADSYPYIKLKVLEAIQTDECVRMPVEECLTTMIDVMIEIAGVQKLTKLEVDCYHIQDNIYHFSAYQDLDMCDFNIEPPTALMGLIQVDRYITIDIDLRVRLDHSS